MGFIIFLIGFGLGGIVTGFKVDREWEKYVKVPSGSKLKAAADLSNAGFGG
jgi:hypothetical protein